MQLPWLLERFLGRRCTEKSCERTESRYEHRLRERLHAWVEAHPAGSCRNCARHQEFDTGAGYDAAASITEHQHIWFGWGEWREDTLLLGCVLPGCKVEVAHGADAAVPSQILAARSWLQEECGLEQIGRACEQKTSIEDVHIDPFWVALTTQGIVGRGRFWPDALAVRAIETTLLYFPYAQAYRPGPYPRDSRWRTRKWAQAR